MKIICTALVLLFALSAIACSTEQASGLSTTAKEQLEEREGVNIMNQKSRSQNLHTIYFAGGCFWGVEHYFQQLTGVEATEVGYANGDGEQTSYQKIGSTGHAETVKIVFDRNRIHPAELIYHFFRLIDPTSLNRQGNDVGTQYRTGIYTDEAELLKLAQEMVAHLQTKIEDKVQIEVEELKNFVTAEEYHQSYLIKNPGGYCHINPKLITIPLSEDMDWPRLKQEERSAQLQADDPAAYKIMREADTEAPFTSALNQENHPGIFIDRISGEPLFSSTEKFDAGCGWPSFTRPILSAQITYHEDLSHNRQRVETRSLESDSHLGHVFPDGPESQGGLRFCINGAALEFIPLEEMEERGYGDYVFFVTY